MGAGMIGALLAQADGADLVLAEGSMGKVYLVPAGVARVSAASAPALAAVV